MVLCKYLIVRGIGRLQVQRYLALDVGDKRIGVAISDALGLTAQALETYERKGINTDIQHFAQLYKEHQPVALVVGLPRNMNGTYGPQAEKVKSYACSLSAALDCPIIYYDERLTTVMAQRTLIQADISRKKRRGIVDRVAAVHILQGFLDAGCPQSGKTIYAKGEEYGE